MCCIYSLRVLREYNGMKEEIKKILKLLSNTLFKYGWYKQKNVWRSGIETTADNYEILWLNEKHIEEGLGHKNLQEITIKYHSDHRKHIY